MSRALNPLVRKGFSVCGALDSRGFRPRVGSRGGGVCTRQRERTAGGTGCKRSEHAPAAPRLRSRLRCSPFVRLAWTLVVVRVTHTMDWGRTPSGRRYALCSCGWRAPARAKLTHGMSDARDHLADVRRRCEAQGWSWWMVKPLGIVTEEPGEGDDQGEDHGVSLPPVVGGEVFTRRTASSTLRRTRRVRTRSPERHPGNPVEGQHPYAGWDPASSLDRRRD